MHDDNMNDEPVADGPPAYEPSAADDGTTPRRSSGGFGVAWFGRHRIVVLFLALHLVVYLVSVLTGGIAGPLDAHLFLDPGLVGIEPWMLVTALFVPVNVFGLLAAVISLFSVGPFLERVLGHSRFAVVYLVGGMAGSVVTLVTNTGPTTGAGPASIAMLGALVVVYLRARTGVGSILQLVLINLVINVLLVGSGGGLYWIGVLGGLVIGALLTFIYSLKPVREHPNRRNSLVVLVVIALLVIAAVRMLLG